MILKYIVKNNTSGDFPLDPGEAWQFIVDVTDPEEACTQIEQVKSSAAQFGHDIMNVYLDGQPFDAKAHWTSGADADAFPYDDTIAVSQVRDETQK